LDTSGAFSEILRISTIPTAAGGIDCVAVDSGRNLYVNDINKHSAYVFKWDGKGYVDPEEIASGVTGPKKGFAIAPSGEVFVAVMGPVNQGWIAKRGVDGKETSFPVKGMPISIALGPDGNIYIPFSATSTIAVYKPDGTLTGEIPFVSEDQSVSDVLIDKNGTIHLAFFHTGKILRMRLKDNGWQSEFLPETFGTPGGIAMDSRGRIYVSDFDGNSIEVVY
jgi:hypothetical protein